MYMVSEGPIPEMSSGTLGIRSYIIPHTANTAAEITAAIFFFRDKIFFTRGVYLF